MLGFLLLRVFENGVVARMTHRSFPTSPSLKRSYALQACIDCLAMAFLLLFVCITAASIPVAMGLQGDLAGQNGRISCGRGRMFGEGSGL